MYISYMIFSQKPMTIIDHLFPSLAKNRPGNVPLFLGGPFGVPCPQSLRSTWMVSAGKILHEKS